MIWNCSKLSHTVTEIIEDKAPVVEKASIDEHYLDLAGMDLFFGTFKWTQELVQYITQHTGLPLSFTLSVNKTVAKIGMVQTNRQKEINQEMVRPFLNPLHQENSNGRGRNVSIAFTDRYPTNSHIGSYAVEVFKEHLNETYGIMVYQEDVIKIAKHFGDYQQLTAIF